MIEEPRISEERLAAALGFDRDRQCCMSCHDDDDEGYGMCEVDEPEGPAWASVCCVMTGLPDIRKQSVWDAARG